jgi:hypothetical protein
MNEVAEPTQPTPPPSSPVPPMTTPQGPDPDPTSPDDPLEDDETGERYEGGPIPRVGETEEQDEL